MASAMWCVLGLWAAWVAAHLLLMAFIRPPVPSFTGFRIVIPDDYKEKLTVAEYCAIHAHEQGHRHHRHVWKNFALVCLFMRPSKEARWRQELEADDYSAYHTDPWALASALRKLGFSPLDNIRARRLEMRAVQGCWDASASAEQAINQ